MEMGSVVGRINGKKRKIQDRNGSTMVSVIVAFVLLMLAVLMLYAAVITSMNLLAKARRNDQDAAAVVERFYESYRATSPSRGSIQLTSSDGSFSVAGGLMSEAISLETGEQKTMYYYQYPDPTPVTP